MKEIFKKLLPDSRFLAGMSFLIAVGIYAYSNRKDSNEDVFERCNQITMERTRNEQDKDLSKLLCNEPCYRNELVKMVDEYGMKLYDLNDAFDYVSRRCNNNEK
ncbi:MAG: hypothetical protein KKA62_03685 [Nanoarchaeota archaeon]|nr:hypothetical protein [Nanoarchaeota archaeon]MBU1644619.1 hypothetical protein [Nanoarchaeota archaeon]MBU1977027.1 hypothetical protein [Nanoarchaeota archaeon]